MDVKEAMKGSRAFMEAMRQAAEAAGQMDEMAREQTAALKELTGEMAGVRAAMERQSASNAKLVETIAAGHDKMAQVMDGMLARLDGIQTALAKDPEDDRAEVDAIGKLAGDMKAGLQAVQKAVTANKPQARKDRTDDVLRALDTLSQEVQRVREAVLAPSKIETDSMGEPVGVVKTPKPKS